MGGPHSPSKPATRSRTPRAAARSRSRAGKQVQTARPGRARGPGKYDRAQSSEERRSDQRARLLGAASGVFAEVGFARASVDAIVRRAGMSRRTFYEHFADLGDALVAVYEIAADTLFRYVEKRIKAESDAARRIEVGVRAYLTLFSRSADLARVFHREIRAAGPERAARHDATLQRFVDLITSALAEARAQQQLSVSREDEAVAFALVAGLEAVAMRYIDRGEEDRILEAAPRLIALMQHAFA